MAGMTSINRALTLVPKRAESRQNAQLRDTFVDSGVAAALGSIDHQVLYGRRGTGKTHALKYIGASVDSRTNLAVYTDLRTVGSPEGLFMGAQVHATERAGRLMRDLLHQVYDALLELAVEADDLIQNKVFLDRLDAVLVAIGSVVIIGEVEQENSDSTIAGKRGGVSAEVQAGASGGFLASLRRESTKATEQTDASRMLRRGHERVNLNFSDVAKALRELADSFGDRRVWLLLDEWSSVPIDVQPYLGEFLVRCILPLQMYTVKIAAIEQQTHFRGNTDEGLEIGIEVGADVSANVDLDDFMVFEQSSERAREFFLGLFYKHLTSGVSPSEGVLGLDVEGDLVRYGFTDRRAFDELVRAAEGVPRDAINIAGKAALKAVDRKISVPDVRSASRAWFQLDKEAALKSREEAQDLLSWLIDEVIRGRRTRGFLVNRRDSSNPLLISLFEARVLHLVRRGYSAQDEPGERYDVYVVDYGAYVDLLHTKYEPQGLLPGLEDEDFADVPVQDLRAIRRAVLDLELFFGRNPQLEGPAGRR